MDMVNIGEEKNCTFCTKSRLAARQLIQSPDHRTYICDECVVEPRKLKLTVEEQEDQKDAGSLPSRFARFLQEHLEPKKLRCSFCQKRLRSRDLYVPVAPANGAQICRECLAVCRQILKDEARTNTLRRDNS